MKKIAYSFLLGDLFHYGHLKMLETGRVSADYHICGVISDSVAQKWNSPIICSYEERIAVVKKISYVDEAVCQDSMDPTDNLRIIHEKHPDAKVLLIQSHSLGENQLGIDYIKEISGDIINHNFYSRLSRDYIAKTFFEAINEKNLSTTSAFNNIIIRDVEYYQNQLSTKANTLFNLKKVLKNAKIEKEFIFTIGQWRENLSGILEEISKVFEHKLIVIRSSSMREDTSFISNAGKYCSLLNIDADKQNNVKEAIENVIDSYSDDNNNNQLLIQSQTEDVVVSGVIFTRNLLTNTPYYLINYDDSHITNSVTSGLISNKIEILRDLHLEQIDSKWRRLISAVREIEDYFFGVALDIEFAIKRNNEIVIFQVRPLAANSKFKSFDDDKIIKDIENIQNKYSEAKNNLNTQFNYLILSDMAFWNPAELIGDRPNSLDYSLFNHLIMKSVWNKALLPLGYSEVKDPLMILIANKPYINVHNAFMSLMPAALVNSLKIKLLNYYNNKLKANPQLHDKIEFDVVYNCYIFDFKSCAEELIQNGFSEDEINILEKKLLDLTNKIILEFEKILIKDENDINYLNNEHNKINKKNKELEWNEKLFLIHKLIEDCKTFGTLQFSRIARMAFIGNALLKSLRRASLISEFEYQAFIGSIETVATEMDNDIEKVRNCDISVDEFLLKYGHLRPGTYDITKPAYKNRKDYFEVINYSGKNYKYSKDADIINKELFLNLEEKIDAACKAHGIVVDGKTLLTFIRKTTEAREYFKFIYTKNISLTLELLAGIGQEFGFTRNDLSMLDYYSIVDHRETVDKEEIVNIWQSVINSRKEEKRLNSLLSLPPIVFSEEDFVIIKSYNSKPNYITNSIVSGEVVFLEDILENMDINDRIIVIEKADPGYDWVFTKNIKALITKYGGAASHMAIRCAEFGIPAAIGCGDTLFSKIKCSTNILLDCKNKTINTLLS